MYVSVYVYFEVYMSTYTTPTPHNSQTVRVTPTDLSDFSDLKIFAHISN